MNPVQTPTEVMLVAMQRGLDVRDRKKMFKTYKDTFLGCEAVDWLLSHQSTENKTLESREEAVEIATRLLEEGHIIAPLKSSKGVAFVDSSKHFYQFAGFNNVNTISHQYPTIDSIVDSTVAPHYFRAHLVGSGRMMLVHALDFILSHAAYIHLTQLLPRGEERIAFAAHAANSLYEEYLAESGALLAQLSQEAKEEIDHNLRFACEVMFTLARQEMEALLQKQLVRFPRSPQGFGLFAELTSPMSNEALQLRRVRVVPTLERMLEHPLGRRYFQKYMETQGHSELVTFYIDCGTYQDLMDSAEAEQLKQRRRASTVSRFNETLPPPPPGPPPAHLSPPPPPSSSSPSSSDTKHDATNEDPHNGRGKSVMFNLSTPSTFSVRQSTVSQRSDPDTVSRLKASGAIKAMFLPGRNSTVSEHVLGRKSAAERVVDAHDGQESRVAAMALLSRIWTRQLKKDAAVPVPIQHETAERIRSARKHNSTSTLLSEARAQVGLDLQRVVMPKFLKQTELLNEMSVAIYEMEVRDHRNHFFPDLAAVIGSGTGLAYFRMHLEARFEDELLRFYEDADRYRIAVHSLKSKSRVIFESHAHQVFDSYLGPQAPGTTRDVLPDKVVSDVASRISKAPNDLFDAAMDFVYRLLRASFKDFYETPFGVDFSRDIFR